MATKRQGRLFQLTRDKGYESLYAIWRLNARPTMRNSGQWMTDVYIPINTMCPGQYNTTAYKSAQLKPGGGPIRVRVIIEAE